MVRRLDSNIDLDVRNVGCVATDLVFHPDSEIRLGGGGNTLGLTITSGFKL